MATKVIDFPAGMTRLTVTGTLSAAGRARSGYVRLYAERKFGYAGTDWIMDEVSDPIPLRAGKFAVEVPHSDQPGLIGDNNQPITNVGYRIEFVPLQSVKAEILAWTLMPLSLGTVVAFSRLGNLGGWPNAIAQGTVAPPSGSNITYILDPNRPGLVKAQSTNGTVVSDPLNGRLLVTVDEGSQLPDAVELTLAIALKAGRAGGVATLDLVTGRVLDGSGKPVGSTSVTTKTLPGITAVGTAVAESVTAAAARTALGIPALLTPLAPKASPVFTGAASGLRAQDVAGALLDSAVGTTLAPLINGMVPPQYLPKAEVATITYNGTGFVYHGVVVTARPACWQVQLYRPANVQNPAWLDPTVDAVFPYPTS